MPRYAASDVSTRVTTSAPGRNQPGDGRGHDPRRQRDDHQAEDGERPPRAGAQRHGLPAHELRMVDERARAGRRACSSIAAHGPWSRTASPATSSISPGPMSSPWRCTASTTSSPARRHHAREHRLADERRPGRDEDLRDARVAPRSEAATSTWAGSSRSRPYWSTSVSAWRDRSAGIAFGSRSGITRDPRASVTAIVPMSSGMPTRANSKNPNPVPGRAPRRSWTR